MADTQVTWRGLTFGTDRGVGDYHVEEINGWDDLPEITSYDQARARGHGDHMGDQFARARIVTVSGNISSLRARDSLALALMNASPVGSALEDLTVQTFGRVLTAGARLVRRSLPVGDLYAAGYIPFALQFRCPDPLRYGTPVVAGTPLPSSGGGLTYPLTYPLTYGAAGDSGQLTVSNPGTAPASITFTATGPLPGGFELSAGGMRLTYPVAVPDGQPVTIDTGTGSVTVEGGTADRRGNLTVADWMQVPPGGSLTVQFTSLGAYDADALLSATVRPAYW